jgi:hypothetical protein
MAYIFFANTYKIATIGEESGGVLRRRTSDQTEVSKITLMFADVGVCSHSLRHNQ